MSVPDLEAQETGAKRNPGSENSPRNNTAISFKGRPILITATEEQGSKKEIRAFLEDLFGGAEKNVLIWTLPDKLSRFFPASMPENAAEYAYAQSATKDVYVGIGTREENFPENRRGGVVDVAELPGLVLDIDIKDPCRMSDNLPATEAEAMDFVSELPFEPSLVVHSGHGLQAWFLFDKPIPVPSQDMKDRASRMLKGLVDLVNIKATPKGWKFDSVGELARVMRIPGTFNRKTDPVPVKLLKQSGKRYDPLKLDEAIRNELPGRDTVQSSKSDTSVPNHIAGGAEVPVGFDDEHVLSFAEKRYKEDFTSPFYRGDASRFGGDQSRADLSLCDMLAFFSTDPAQVDRLFRKSALMRPKWDERHGTDGSTYGQMTVDKAVKSARERLETPRAAQNAVRMEEISVRQILGREGRDIMACVKRPEPENAEKTDMVAGLFPKGHVSIIFGEPGSGKSLMSLRIACDLSAGRAPLGGYTLPEEPKNVLVIEGDCASNLINERLRCSRWEHGEGLRFVYPMESRDWDFDIDNDRGKNNILALIEEIKPELIIFDTLSSLAGQADEISNKEMKPLFLYAGRVAAKYGAAVLVIHHARKFKRDDSGKPLTLNDVSGAGMLGRLSGNVLAVEGREDEERKIVTLRTVKSWWPYAQELSVEVTKGYWDDDNFSKMEMNLIETPGSKITKGGLVRETVLSEFRGTEFTRREVELFLKGKACERTVRNVLSEMSARGELSVIKYGSSTSYRIAQMGEVVAGEGETA